MAIDFKKLGRGLLIGAGSVLSIIPAVGPVVGAGLITAGLAIDTGSKSADKVSNAASNLVAAYNTAGAMTATASGANVINVNTTIELLKKYGVYIVGGIVLLFFLFKKRR